MTITIECANCGAHAVLDLCDALKGLIDAAKYEHTVWGGFLCAKCAAVDETDSENKADDDF